MRCGTRPLPLEPYIESSYRRGRDSVWTIGSPKVRVTSEQPTPAPLEIMPGCRLSEASANLNMLLRYRRSPHPRPILRPLCEASYVCPKVRRQKEISREQSQEGECVPRPTSARLAGLTADSEIARRKAEESNEVTKREAEAKKMQVSGHLSVGNIVVNGQAWMDIGDDFTTKRRLRICALLAKIM